MVDYYNYTWEGFTTVNGGTRSKFSKWEVELMGVCQQFSHSYDRSTEAKRERDIICCGLARGANGYSLIGNTYVFIKAPLDDGKRSQ